MRYSHLVKPLNEVFDQPYPTQWQKYSDGYNVYFEVANGDTVMIQFEEWRGPDVWLVAFKRGGSWLQTNTGDEFRIFATVIHAIKEFIQKVNPTYIAFISNKGEGSRSKLYQKIMQRLLSSTSFVNMTNKLDKIPDTITRNWLKNKIDMYQEYDIFVLMRSDLASKPVEKDNTRSYNSPNILRVGNLRAQESVRSQGNQQLDENGVDNIINNVRGAGAVPNNQDVDYFGMRVKVKPSVFLKLSLPLEPESEYLTKLIQYLKNGGQIGSPFLEIQLPDAWFEGKFEELPRVKGHEGRHRMMAIQEIWGDIPVETHLFFRGGVRARNLTPDIQRALNEEIISESGRAVMGPWFR
ncbi:MAG: hypothetical protein N2235_08405 [Fischerella sp.]|nr:hypothetical protein [Fischerella sp.]